MECRDVRDMADTFLAQERLTEASQILQHLDTCPACRVDLAARRVLRQSVRRAFQNARDLDPTPGFTMRLRATLHEAAQHEPRHLGITDGGRWLGRSLPRRWWPRWHSL
jgi:anti-sigma factor RsiW